jgi:DNA-binding transcriptional LysR family regulator
MDPTLHQLRVFVSFADITSFTRSARELHLSQPVISRTVRELEMLLGRELPRRASAASAPIRMLRSVDPTRSVNRIVTRPEVPT